MRTILIPNHEEQLRALAILLEDPDWRPEPAPCDELALEEARFLIHLVATAKLSITVHEGNRLAITPGGMAPLGLIAGLAALHDQVLQVLQERDV